MDYLSRNSVVLDQIFHGFSLYFTEITCHLHACIHAHIQIYAQTHTKCSYIAIRIMLDKIWMHFSYRGKNEFPHLHIYF